MRANAYLQNVSFRPETVTRPSEISLNPFDVCLLRDNQMWDLLLNQGGLKRICKGHPEYIQPPWVAMPKEGRRFKPVSSLLVSDAEPFTGLNVAVLQERVPLGYDGVISDVVCGITPGADGITGFVEGSGDLVWRLSSDTRYLRDMGNITTSLGSLTSPSPVPRGMLRVYSHDLLVFSVALAVGAEARISSTARIVCSITGWFWPR